VRRSVLVLFLLPVIVNATSYKECFANPPTAKTMLWEISGNGLGQPSYILGTLHSGCAKQLALSMEQASALARSHQLYTELSYARSKSVDKSLQSKKQRRLKDLIDPAQYQVIEDFFGEDVLDRKRRLEEQEPEDIINDLVKTLTRDVNNKFLKRRCKETTSKEAILVASANRYGIGLGGIETYRDRSTVLQRVSLKAVADQLVSMVNEYLNSPDSVFEKLAEFHRLYTSQDIHGIDARANDALKKPLVEDRNRLWVPRMQNAMKQKPTFFAFGAAHLGGNAGVIALLESKGYRLRPIFDKSVANPLAAKPRRQEVLKASDYLEIGQKKEEEGEFLEAIDNYSQALVLNFQYVEAYTRRADLRLNNIVDIQGAMMDLNQAIAIAPENADLYYNRAVIKRDKLKDLQGALADLSRIIEINPRNSIAYFHRGMLKKQSLNTPQSALLDFDNHLLLAPQSINGYVERGLLKYVQLADKAGGIADLRRASYLARINVVKNSDEYSYQRQQEVDRIQAILRTMGDKL
jgi:uncharacterized protein